MRNFKSSKNTTLQLSLPWVISGLTASLIFGLIDGGLSVAIAYGVNEISKKVNL